MRPGPPARTARGPGLGMPLYRIQSARLPVHECEIWNPRRLSIGWMVDQRREKLPDSVSPMLSHGQVGARRLGRRAAAQDRHGRRQGGFAQEPQRAGTSPGNERRGGWMPTRSPPDAHVDDAGMPDSKGLGQPARLEALVSLRLLSLQKGRKRPVIESHTAPETMHILQLVTGIPPTGTKCP